MAALDPSQNPTSPFYLHPYDNPGQKLVNLKFDGNSYGDWKRSMLISLSAKNKLGFVEQALHEIKQDQDNISGYYTKTKMIWDQLDAVDPIPLCSCFNCNCQITQRLLKSQQDRRLVEFLMKLNDGFEVVRGSILMLNPLPNISHAYRLLVQEEKHKQLYQTHATSTESMAFAVNRRFSEHDRSRQNYHTYRNTDQRRVNYYCDHCKIPGHNIQRCYKLKGYPQGTYNDKGNYTDKGKRVAANVEFTDHEEGGNHDNDVTISGEQYEKFLKYQLTQQMAEMQATSSGENALNNKSAHVAGKFRFTSSVHAKWILDSAATDHMCFDSSLFDTLHQYSGTENLITIPNGKQVAITHLGTITLNSQITLSNVLYVPDFRYNLISIPKLCKDLNCHATFTNNDCYIQGSSHKPILLGKLKNGLYCLEDSVLEKRDLTTPFAAATPNSTFNSIDANKVKLWHLRLGHIPVSKLHFVVCDICNKDCSLDSFCQICPVARQTRMSFPVRSIKTKVPFELLHFDVWGPNPDPTYNGCKIFLTIVDDFSRITWIFLMHYKSDAVKIFKHFV
uniref:Retrotransposon Copia-like N-terminal domain-containing protein n=1 Tax=Chenopodium quinoa TaxID=63459 RepID=A0A803MYU7_CHEQI